MSSVRRVPAERLDTALDDEQTCACALCLALLAAAANAERNRARGRRRLRIVTRREVAAA